MSRVTRLLLPWLLVLLMKVGYSSVVRKRVVYVNSKGEVSSAPHNDSTVARIQYRDFIDKSGWSYLRVSTNSSERDEIQARTAGVGEGYITATRILQTWNNTMSGYCVKSSDYCEKLKKYIVSNLAWMRQQIEDKKGVSEYWHQVHLLLIQIEGLFEGVNMVYPGKLALHDIYLLNLNLDLMDMEDALGTDETGFNRNRFYLGKEEVTREKDEVSREKERMLEKVLGSGHCTALVRWTGGDLLCSHVTWNSYSAMVRVVKRYDLGYRRVANSGEVIPGRVQVFTSYPGYLFSGDDFTLISTGILAQETTIANLNPALWEYVHPENSVPEFMRAVVANRLAKTGKSWCSVFEQFNSGTYNNQWMIVDYNKFTPDSETLKAGTLYVLEQLPGHIVHRDMTKLLVKQKYWPSYNLPYYPEIFNLTGIQEFVDKFGDIFSYSRNPRALIFQRDAHTVSNMDSLYKLMRYNDFQHDPLSKCNCTPPYSAINAISSRSDLNPLNGSYPLPLLGSSPNGGIDYKGTNHGLMLKMSMRIAGGPTWEQQPPFKWSTSPWANVSHEGMADLQQFEEIAVSFKEEQDFVDDIC